LTKNREYWIIVLGKFIDGVDILRGAEIIAVAHGSLAEELGLSVGDTIMRINQKRFTDLINFQWEWATEEVLLEIKKSNGEREVFKIEKDYDEPLGVDFRDAVFDRIKPCANKCIFCFVEQMPKKMRASLYLKDDDYRLSFLQGNYITMSNLEKEDLLRIKEEHLSPLYLSVHTTDPELRRQMMKNPRAGEIMPIMQDLAQEGIEFHTQVVACPGINDGEALEKTYRDLSKLEGVMTLAVVPVGLTAYRHNLPEIRLFTKAEARRLVEWVERVQQAEGKLRGSGFIWASDEFYLLGEVPIPPAESYEDFSQLENGVGMVRRFWDEWQYLQLPEDLGSTLEIFFVTGVLGEKVLKPVIARLNTIKGLNIKVLSITNTYFGPTVTVAGLLTGTCLIKGLNHLQRGSIVFIPEFMVQSGNGKFLDDLRPDEVAKTLGIKIYVVSVEAAGILAKIMELRGR